MKEAINEVEIEGVVAEAEIKVLDNGAKAGKIVLMSRFQAGGEEIVTNVPVEFYAVPEYKDKITGQMKENRAFKDITKLFEEMRTLAEGASEEEATKLRTFKNKIKENIFAGRDGKVLSSVRISGSFFEKVKPGQFKPHATFKTNIIVDSIKPEEKMIDGELTPTGALQVNGFIVQWNGTIDSVKFVVKERKYIKAIEQGWSKGDTVGAAGFLNFSTYIEEVPEISDGFGEPQMRVFSRNIREFVINNGSQGSLEESYDLEEVSDAVQERLTRQQNVEANAKAPKTTVKKPNPKDLGW